MQVVITGASRGLGKAMAESFASRGNKLWLCSQHDLSLYKAVEDLMLRYPDVLIKARPFNLSIKKEAIAFGEWILQSGGSPDVLINNAGQFLPGSIHNEEEGVLEKMVEINLYSAYHLTRSLLPAMMAKKSGHIFNICSIASFAGRNETPWDQSHRGLSRGRLHGFLGSERNCPRPFYGGQRYCRDGLFRFTTVSPGLCRRNSPAASVGRYLIPT